MAFQYPVPAQESAADYLAAVTTLWQGPVMLMGHSKGGNLAVYAALHASGDLDARITRVYSLDGPGFPEAVVCGERYRSLISRIDKIVPSSSIVGMILETPEPSRVVQSDQRGSCSIWPSPGRWKATVSWNFPRYRPVRAISIPVSTPGCAG